MKSAFLSLLNRQTFQTPRKLRMKPLRIIQTTTVCVRFLQITKDSSAVILKHSGKSEICFIRIGLIPLTILQTGSEYSLPPVKQAVCTEPASDGAGF